MLHQRGFTLLELLVVVAILATIAGALIVAYDGLDVQAEKGVATFNIAGLDQAIRTYKLVNKEYPDDFDGLVVENTALSSSEQASSGGWLAMLPSQLAGSDGDSLSADGKLRFHALSQAGVDALSAAGVENIRVIQQNNNGTSSIPNRVFDDPSRGRGVQIPLASGVVVPVIEDAISNLSASTSERLEDIAGLDASRGHLVVCFGVGNNSSLVGEGGRGTLAEAPIYGSSARDEYSRFLVLFHLATDQNGDGSFDADEYFGSARYLAILDTFGDWYDEEYAEYTGQKE